MSNCDVIAVRSVLNEVLEFVLLKKILNPIDECRWSPGLFYTTQETKIAKKIQALADVGMGYVALGQSSTLSGGEAQRIKLASHLTKGIAKKVFCSLRWANNSTYSTILKSCWSFRQIIDRGHRKYCDWTQYTPYRVCWSRDWFGPHRTRWWKTLSQWKAKRYR